MHRLPWLGRDHRSLLKSLGIQGRFISMRPSARRSNQFRPQELLSSTVLRHVFRTCNIFLLISYEGEICAQYVIVVELADSCC